MTGNYNPNSSHAHSTVEWSGGKLKTNLALVKFYDEKLKIKRYDKLKLFDNIKIINAFRRIKSPARKFAPPRP